MNQVARELQVKEKARNEFHLRNWLRFFLRRCKLGIRSSQGKAQAGGLKRCLLTSY